LNVITVVSRLSLIAFATPVGEINRADTAVGDGHWSGFA